MLLLFLIFYFHTMSHKGKAGLKYVLCLVNVILELKLRALHVLDENSINHARFQAMFFLLPASTHTLGVRLA